MTRPFQVKAIFEYASPHEDDLNFAAGQIITVTDEEDDDWYGGEYVDSGGLKQHGIFPRNFVEKYEPTAPLLPTRACLKKEPELALPPEDIGAAIGQPRLQPKQEEPEADEAVGNFELSSPVEHISPTMAHASSPSRPTEDGPALATSLKSNAGQLQPMTAPAMAASSVMATPKTKHAAAPPPPTSEKPTASSFKDRIAAFNKPTAPPIAPFKPGGMSGGGGNAGFIKKPFVAPPPSRNAYVPSERETATSAANRREEDVENKERGAANSETGEKAGLAPASQSQGDDPEDQPKPTSLKERIALLQKQQMEQAQRHADAAAKKEKPKKTPKKRVEQTTQVDRPEEAAEAAVPPLSDPREAEDRETRTSTEEAQPARVAPTPRRKLSKGPTSDSAHDGNDADMSGAGDTTERQDDTTERDDSDGTSLRAVRHSITAAANEMQDEYKEVEENVDEVDPEIRRKEELRARMAKMSGGMGFHGMFGASMAPVTATPPKKKTPKAETLSVPEEAEQANPVSRSALPIPTPMELAGIGGTRPPTEPKHPGDEESAARTRAATPPVPIRTADGDGQEGYDDEDDDDDNDNEEKAEDREEAATTAPQPEIQIPKSGPPPLIGGRPARAPVPSENRPPPPPPPPPPAAADVKSATDGSESDDELSAGAREKIASSVDSDVARSPPTAAQPLHSPRLPARSPPLSPRPEDSSMPVCPHIAASKRMSRPPPPPIPGSAPLPPAAHNRPPAPPPAGASREVRAEEAPPMPPIPSRPPQAGEEENEENTEYEGDYDTDIGSSVPHKDALKAHARDSSVKDNGPQSPARDMPAMEAPPLPAAAAPRAVPPSIPWQAPPESGKRRSMDAPRAVPPPPPVKEARTEAEYRAYGQLAHDASHEHRTATMDEETLYSGPLRSATAPERRAPQRPSMDVPRPSMSGRRSTDVHRSSMESGFIANDVDLAVQTGWWKQANQVPPLLQGRRDMHFENEESATTNQGARTVVTRTVYVLFQDYSQTIVKVRYDPRNASDVELEQRHEAPPRALRQDQMEEFHDRFGRRISEAALAKKDTVVGDGTPQGLVVELLRPLGEALWPVGTRAYGALVYSNMANASTQQHDMIRPGDIMSIRNAKFQGKHGPMHAKYSAEVGKPDHVAVVAKWDGTKKKVRAWEQGRESKKVKLESFKLDDLRSGEVKIWRVVPRGWIGWNSRA